MRAQALATKFTNLPPLHRLVAPVQAIEEEIALLLNPEQAAATSPAPRTLARSVRRDASALDHAMAGASSLQQHLVGQAHLMLSAALDVLRRSPLNARTVELLETELTDIETFTQDILNSLLSKFRPVGFGELPANLAAHLPCTIPRPSRTPPRHPRSSCPTPIVS